MTKTLIIVSAVAVGIIVLVGIVRASLWFADRKKHSETQSWIDSAHAGGDGWPMHGDAGREGSD